MISMAFTGSVYDLNNFRFHFLLLTERLNGRTVSLQPNGRTLNYERAAPAHGVLLRTNVGVISSVSPPTAHKGRMIKVRSFHSPLSPAPDLPQPAAAVFNNGFIPSETACKLSGIIRRSYRIHPAESCTAVGRTRITLSRQSNLDHDAMLSFKYRLPVYQINILFTGGGYVPSNARVS